MKTARSWGFTLIELLTVIAIIAILAALTAVTLPGVRERAKIASTENDLNHVKVALATYYADGSNGSYPPAYGYRQWQTRDELGSGLDPIADWDIYYWHVLYIDLPGVDLRGVFDTYDEWSRSYDTDGSGAIEHFEFDPIATAPPPDPFYDQPFFGADGFDTLTGADNRDEARPYIYIPVNRSQLNKVRRYYENNDDYKATSWDLTTPTSILRELSFPPPRYDAFVLISVGPQENTCGIVNPPPGVLATIKGELSGFGTPQDLYHVLGLRAFYLASRDLNENGDLDYDYRSRRRGEGKADAFPAHAAWDVHEMPAPTKNLYGPLILVQEG